MSCKVTQGNGLMKAASWKKDLGCSVQAELRNRPEAGRGVWLGPGREAGTEAMPSLSVQAQCALSVLLE